MFFAVIGFFGFFVSLVMLVVALIRKKGKKASIIVMGISVVLLAAGGATMPRSEIPAAVSSTSSPPAPSALAATESAPSKAPASSSDAPSAESAPTVDPAALLHCAAGEFNTLYDYDTRQIGADGKTPARNGLQVISVTKQALYENGDAEHSNAIVFKAAGDYTSIHDFVADFAFMNTSDSKGKQRTDFSSAVYENGDYVDIVFYSEKDITDVVCASLGGFSRANGQANQFAFLL